MTDRAGSVCRLPEGSVSVVRASIDRIAASGMVRGSACLLSVLVVSGAILVPGAVLADTGPGTTGGTAVDPGLDPLRWLLGATLALSAIAIVLGAVIGLAFLLARVGGPAVATKVGPGIAVPYRSRSATNTMLSAFGAAVVITAGVIIGRTIAYQGSVGGLGGWVGQGLLTFGLGALIVSLTSVALIATAIRRGHLTRAIATVLAAAGLVSAGGLGGYVTAAALGGTYREPVVRASAGQTTVALQTGATLFVARRGGSAECHSVPDGVTVASVTALDLGELGSGTLRATLTLPDQPSGGAVVELFIDGADLLGDSPQPSWSGPAQVAGLGAESADGTVLFTRLVLSNADAKGGTSATSGSVSEWPTTVSGSLTWTCKPWAMPLAGSAAPSPSVGP